MVFTWNCFTIQQFKYDNVTVSYIWIEQAYNAIFFETLKQADLRAQSFSQIMKVVCEKQAHQNDLNKQCYHKTCFFGIISGLRNKLK